MCEFGLHHQTRLHLRPVIWHNFHVIKHWDDPLNQLLCSRGENTQIIINQLGMNIKTLNSNNNHIFHDSLKEKV